MCFYLLTLFFLLWWHWKLSPILPHSCKLAELMSAWILARAVWSTQLNPVRSQTLTLLHKSSLKQEGLPLKGSCTIRISLCQKGQVRTPCFFDASLNKHVSQCMYKPEQILLFLDFCSEHRWMCGSSTTQTALGEVLPSSMAVKWQSYATPLQREVVNSEVSCSILSEEVSAL